MRHRFDDFALAGFIASAAAILALAAADYWASNRQERAAQWVAHTHEVRANIARARSDIMALMAIRDDDAYRAGVAALKVDLARLRDLTDDNSDQAHRLDAIQAALYPRLDNLAPGDVMAADRILSSFDGDESRLLDERKREEGRTVTWFRFISAIAITVMLLVISSLFLLERRRSAERDELLQSEQRFQLMARSIRDYAIIMLDREGRVASWNEGAERIKGWRADEILGKHFSRFYPDDVASFQVQEKLETAASQGRFSEEGWRTRKDGSKFWGHVIITALRDESGELQGFVKITHDLTERKRAEDALRAEVGERRLAEEALRELIGSLESVVAERTSLLSAAVQELSTAKERVETLAHHDPLTGLPNRRLLLDRLQLAMANARRRKRQVGILFIDLDRFKEINDSLGHDAGDAVLKEVARRLKACVREGDTVSREGGDEFVVVLPDLEHREDARRVAEKTLRELGAPIRIGEVEARVTPSIGVSYFPDDATEPQQLLKCADDAMYRAKDAGRNAVHFYKAETQRVS